eukprot:MONOS_12149.1-p1 / transcript=MONOS_12149.1 / gene=MONOS_12149 / organism=Monocercomonoides_exilis_PA203 / gene_product=unspecified product / transcript_product=unspecified product / location=Mono_scaffold00652:27863-29178(+) / protein_length=289 / sequence_SO=supercontig / SO=protein_coding / is_pseudo=false
MKNKSANLKELEFRQFVDLSVMEMDGCEKVILFPCVLEQNGKSGASEFIVSNGEFYLQNVKMELDEQNMIQHSIVSGGGEKAGFLLRRGAYFDGCCASSICACSPSPFLCSEKLEMAEVMDCLFCNVTMHHNGKGCCDRTLQRSVVENCEIEGCEDVFGGGIVSGARGNEFSARNSTFCRMTSAYHDSHYTTPFDEFTTGEVSFVNCDFENCRSTSHGGGAIYVGGTASLSVQRCTFTNVLTTVGRGGAIYSYSTSSVEINGTSFTRCSSDGLFGGALAVINSSLSMDE